MSTYRRSPIRLRLEELERRVTPTVTVVPQHFATNQYTALTITQSQLLAGDSGGATLKASNPTQPAHATLADNNNGTFTFTPDPSFTGGTTFQYTVAAAAPTELPAPQSPGGFNFFGDSVSINGDTAVIGASDQTVNGQANEGAAYVFVRSGNGWVQQAQLTAVDGSSNDLFGHSVSVSGNKVVIGAESHTANGHNQEGAAYVFARSGSTWSQQAELTAPDGIAEYHFGASVAISGDTVVVGQQYIGVPTRQGSAYVFARSGSAWNLQAQLAATDGSNNDGFGRLVSISGDTAVIGGFQPKVYVLVRSAGTWTQQAELTASDDVTFGSSVAVSGDTALVGSLSEAAYVFVRSGSTWSRQAKLTTAAGRSISEFGFSVAVDGDTAVVGADLFAPPGMTDGGTNGAAYVFVRSGSTWTQQAQYIGPPASGDFSGFGSSVSVSGDTAVIGASGRAFVVDLGSATATATVQVNPATAQLFVSPATLPAGVEGQTYAGPAFTATGGAGSGYTFQESGILPPGITFDPATARLVGKPTQTGFYPGIVIAVGDGKGGSGSQTYTLFVTHYGVNGQPVPFPQTIYAPPTSKTDPNAADHAFLRGLYHSVLDRDVEGDAALNYWEALLSGIRADPGQFHLSSGTDPYLYVANGFWKSQEHRWREVESFYHDFLGRDLDLANATNVAERQYWANQFQNNGLSETDVVRSFITSPEYLFHHRGDSSLTAVLNADLLAGKGTAINLLAWTTALSRLDARRGSLQGQSFATPEAYKAQLAPDLDTLDNEATHTGVLFDVLASDEYVQPALDSFYQAFYRRAGTMAEKQTLLGLRDGNNNPLPLGTIAPMLLGAAEYRTNAVNSEV